MARCRECGIEIPDGAEYCDECFSKLNTAKDSESYLDSLLNAVMTEEPKRREIAFQKKEASSPVSVSKNEKKEVKKEVEKVADPVVFAKEEELPELENYSIFDEMDEVDIDQMLDDDLLFAESNEQEEPEQQVEIQDDSDIFSLLEEAEEEEVSASDAFSDLNDLFTDEAPVAMEDLFDDVAPVSAEDLFDDEAPASAEDLFDDEFPIAEEEAVEEFDDVVPIENDEFGDFANLFAGNESESEDSAPVSDLFEEMSEAPEGEVGLDALFPGMDEVQEEDAGLDALFSNLDEMKEEVSATQDSEEPVTFEQMEADSDFADFFAEFGDDAGDFFEFGAEAEEIGEPKESMPVTDEGGSVAGGAKDETSRSGAKEKREKKKSGPIAALFHKLFDNVKVDPSKIKPEPTKEEIEAKKKAAKEAKERSKEEKEALLAEKKEQERLLKLEKQKSLKEAKAEKKARKLEEAKLLLEEMEGTRINRAGASIVFIFFAMIAVVIVVGTSIFSYSLSIRNAQYEFDRDEYTLAYNEIFGLDIKDEDIVLYDRIMTVMYVQKQLNSYYNYYEMKDYPKALDSLLKGLQRYEKYIELAIELEIESDLDSVRSGILEELDASFYISEQEAMGIIQSDSQLEYSMKVYDATDGMGEEPEEG